MGFKKPAERQNHHFCNANERLNRDFTQAREPMNKYDTHTKKQRPIAYKTTTLMTKTTMATASRISTDCNSGCSVFYFFLSILLHNLFKNQYNFGWKKTPRYNNNQHNIANQSVQVVRLLSRLKEQRRKSDRVLIIERLIIVIMVWISICLYVYCKAGQANDTR